MSTSGQWTHSICNSELKWNQPNPCTVFVLTAQTSLTIMLLKLLFGNSTWFVWYRLPTHTGLQTSLYSQSHTCVLLLVAWQLMHMAADLCAQAVDDLIQGLGAGGVHTDEELKLLFVHSRRTRLDVCQVHPLFLSFMETGHVFLY